MRTLTERQAFDAAIRWLQMHVKSMTDPHLSDLLGYMLYSDLDREGWPLTNDPGEWDEWTRCVSATFEAGDTPPLRQA